MRLLPRLLMLFVFRFFLARRGRKLKKAPPCPHCADRRPGAACVARNYGFAERCIRDRPRRLP